MKMLYVMVVLALFAASPPEEHPGDPGKRYGHILTYNPLNKNLLLFGGFREDRSLLGDLWIFDGHSWKTLKTTHGPAPRKWPAAAFSPDGVLLLHGGRVQTSEGEVPTDETWIFKEGIWKKLQIPGPPGLDHHSLVFDEVNKRFVLFGGWDGKTLSAKTWIFEDGSWSNLEGAGPAPRGPMGLTYNTQHQKVYLFGGKDLQQFFGDTWVLDNETWIKLDIPGPSARAFHGMVFHPIWGGLVVFSGRFGNNLFQETWMLKGTEWKIISNEGPVRRGVFSMTYYPKVEAPVFYGSGILEDGQWHLEKGLWGFLNGQWQRLD